MSKILANQIANYGDNSPVEVKEGVNIPAGKPLQASGVTGSNGQVLTSTGTTVEWTTPFSGNYNDLTNKPTIPAAQVNSDWNAVGTVSEILNKPIVPPQPSVSVVNSNASGNLTYNQSNGEFTFTPPDLSPYALATSVANAANWDLAYSWGDHGLAGYITNTTFNTALQNSSNWDTAYGWGDHASASYLTAEIDTLDSVTSRSNDTQNSITVGGLTVSNDGAANGSLNISDTGSYTQLTFYNSSGTSGASIQGVENNLYINAPGFAWINTYSIFYPSGDVTLNNGQQGTTTFGNGFTVQNGTISGIDIEDLDNVDITAGLSDQQVLKWDAASSSWKPANDLVGGSNAIELADLSVSTAPAGSAALSYNDTNGVFTYTPPDLSSYITTETDPVFSASVAAGILQTNVNNWNTSYGWGNHATAGYATTTQLNTAVANSANWDLAYSWGDHSLVGYLTSYTETDTLQSVTGRGSSINNDINLQNNTSITFGTSGGLQYGIYANGSNLIIENKGANTEGDIYLYTDTFIIGTYDGTGTMARFFESGQAELYFSNIKKLETTSAGVTVAGDLNFTGDLYQNGVLFSGGGGGANVTISDTAPGSASAGDLWWESDKGRLKIYYNDTDSTQWVDASPPLAQPNVPVAAGNINMNANSPTWTGTTGYTVTKSGGDGSALGGDVFYTLTFPTTYSARTDYIVQASYDGTDWVSANGAQIGIERNAANVVFCVRRWNEDPLNLGDIMVTITNL